MRKASAQPETGLHRMRRRECLILHPDDLGAVADLAAAADLGASCGHAQL